MIEIVNNIGKKENLDLSKFQSKGDLKPKDLIVFKYTYFCPETQSPQQSNYLIGTILSIENENLSIKLRDDFTQEIEAEDGELITEQNLSLLKSSLIDYYTQSTNDKERIVR